jgi:uncharacterized protein
LNSPANAMANQRAAPAGAIKQPIGWPIFLLQLVSVGLAYFLGSLLPIIPALIETIASAAQDPQAASGVQELGSALIASTIVGSAVVGMLVAWLWLRREGRVAQGFRLEAPASWRSTLGWAVLGLGGTILIFTFGALLAEVLGLGTPDPTFILDLVTESPATLALWIVAVAWFGAGFSEEVLYRGFLMDRLERLSGLRGRPWLVLLIQALLFGLPHAYQGLGGMMVTAMAGFWLGWIRNRCGGNLWGAIIAHAAVDTVMMGLAYADKVGW